jgi:hypothetical protein
LYHGRDSALQPEEPDPGDVAIEELLARVVQR